MKRKLVSLAFALAAALSLLAATLVLADPDMPFYGEAHATGVDLDLRLNVTGITVDVEVEVGREEAEIQGAAGVVSTQGQGWGVLVTETSALIDASVAVVNTSAGASTAVPDVVEDTDFVLNLNSLLVDTGLISSTTRAESLATRQTVGKGIVDGLFVMGDPLGIDAFVVAETVSETVHVVSTAAGSAANEEALARLEGVSVNLFPTVGQQEILSADVVSATAATSCDSDPAVMNSAAVDYGFVNLEVLGVPVVVTDPGTQIVVDLFGVDVAIVTIGPEHDTTVTNGTADAHSQALRIDLIADVGLLQAGTVVNLASTQAYCQIPTPTDVNLSGFSGENSASLTPTAVTLGAILLPALYLALRRRAARV